MDLLYVKHFPSGSVKNMIDFLLSLCRGELCCNSMHFVRIKTKVQAGSTEQNGMQERRGGTILILLKDLYPQVEHPFA